MARPKLALMLSEVWTMIDPRDLGAVVQAARDAEDAGFDYVMIGEHVALGRNAASNGVPANPRELLRAGTQPPSYPHPSGLHLLSAVAATTSRIGLLAAALLSPLRHPLLLAKELATLDLLSQGRLVVLPAVSWQREEYEALGVRFEHRGSILDEQLEIWRRLWSEGSPISFEGEHFRFEEMYIEPGPWRPGGPPIWIGGRSLSSPWVFRRATQHASGVFPLVPPSAEELDRLREARVAPGAEPLEVASIVSGAFPDASSVLDLDAVLDSARPLVDRGVTTLVLKPSQFVDDRREVPAFCDRVVRWAASLG